MIMNIKLNGQLPSGFPTRSDTNRAVQPQKMAQWLGISCFGSRGINCSIYVAKTEALIS